MLINEGVKELLAAIESKDPTPGGGSVSALVGAMGSCLAMMYQNLSFDKSGFMALEKDQQDRFRAVFDELALVQKRLLILCQKDADAYDGVMSAYRLPKDSDEEKKRRKAEIEKATLTATETPLVIMETACAGLELIKDIVGYGNKNAISDAGVAAILLAAAAQGAALNVKINLPILGLEKQDIYRQKSDKLVATCEKLKETVLAIVAEELE